jgi:hypothetical protein
MKEIEGNIQCFKCGGILKKLGGILLSPPSDIHVKIQVVEKRHICTDCYNILIGNDTRFVKISNVGHNTQMA